MSVSREMTIRLVTNKDLFSDLFIEFIIDLLNPRKDISILSLDIEDIDDLEFKNFADLRILKSVLDYRENKGCDNQLSFFVEKYDETIYLTSKKNDEISLGYKSQYELRFSFGVGRRIQNAERYTDYGFYLSDILPRLIGLDCYICEIKCQDYDS